MKNRIIATRSGNQITSIINGESFSVTLDTREEAIELYKEILGYKTSGTDEDVKDLKEILSPGFKVNSQLGDKLQKDRVGNYYLGTNVPLPLKLMETIKENLEEGLPISQLEKFWKLLCLNPDTHVRESLFRFMDRFQMPITDNGYFIAYKSVAWKGEQDKQLGVFVSQQYVNKKAAGKSTKDLLVIEVSENRFELKTEEEFEALVNETIERQTKGMKEDLAVEYLTENHKFKWKQMADKLFSDEEIIEYAESLGYEEPAQSYIANRIAEESDLKSIGFLDELFKNISSMFDFDSPTFTDWHTKKSTIVLGEPVSMPREECDNNPDNTCSSGLHVGAPGYVSMFGGRSSDNYILACLVNPMNVVAIPHDYGYEKMRTSEYLPYAVCEFKDGNIQELETNYFEEDYINYEVELLKTMSADIDGTTEEGKEQLSIISDRLVELG